MTRKNRKKMKRYTRKNNSEVYTQEDYNSNDGMLTSVWGPPLWHYLHTMSFNYPVEPTNKQKEKYRCFVLNLKNVLPCGKCRKNLLKNFKKLPLEMKHMKNRETFSKYVFDLHELVNTMLNKKSGLTYDEVRERYEHFRARCIQNFVPKKEEIGCVVPLYGTKSKCLLKIVPADTKSDTLEIDQKCIKSKVGGFSYI